MTTHHLLVFSLVIFMGVTVPATDLAATYRAAALAAQTPDDRAAAWDLLAQVYRRSGQTDVAVKTWREALSDPALSAAMRANLRNGLLALYLETLQTNRAEALSQEMLREPGSMQAALLGNLAALRHSQVRYEEAETLYRRAVEQTEREQGPDSLALFPLLNNWALLYQETQRSAIALPLLARAARVAEHCLGPEHQDLVLAWTNLAAIHRDLRQFAASHALFERALPLADRTFGPSHAVTASVRSHFTGLLIAEGRKKEARAFQQRGNPPPAALLDLRHLRGLP